jgi:hypothetical protein
MCKIGADLKFDKKMLQQWNKFGSTNETDTLQLQTRKSDLPSPAMQWIPIRPVSGGSLDDVAFVSARRSFFDLDRSPAKLAWIRLSQLSMIWSGGGSPSGYGQSWTKKLYVRFSLQRVNFEGYNSWIEEKDARETFKWTRRNIWREHTWTCIPASSKHLIL